MEREIIAKHIEAGIKAERVPLSGATGYQGNVGDVDIYMRGANLPPEPCEVKARKDGKGFKQLEGWMGDHRVMFLKRDRQQPMVVITWGMWLNLVKIATAFHRHS